MLRIKIDNNKTNKEKIYKCENIRLRRVQFETLFCFYRLNENTGERLLIMTSQK